MNSSEFREFTKDFPPDRYNQAMRQLKDENLICEEVIWQSAPWGGLAGTPINSIYTTK